MNAIPTPSIVIEPQHRRVVRASVREPQLHAIVAALVADAGDVDLTSAKVKCRTYTTSYTEGSLGTGKPEICVEITEDLS